MAMQGDAYYLPLSGTGFTLGEVDLIEFVIGQLRKTYPGEVGYDEDNALFLFPLSSSRTRRACSVRRSMWMTCGARR